VYVRLNGLTAQLPLVGPETGVAAGAGGGAGGGGGVPAGLYLHRTPEMHSDAQLRHSQREIFGQEIF
jgi:hypothetical protein